MVYGVARQLARTLENPEKAYSILINFHSPIDGNNHILWAGLAQQAALHRMDGLLAAQVEHAPEILFKKNFLPAQVFVLDLMVPQKESGKFGLQRVRPMVCYWIRKAVLCKLAENEDKEMKCVQI